MLSAYYNSLSPSDKISYAAKLTLVNGIRLNDPYALHAGEWINDEKKWPKIQWPDIHSYLIETPSVYSRESLKSYKTLDAYCYVTDNHVQDILFHDYNIENFVALKTEVLPSQRQGKRTEMYKVWVVVNKKNNCILTANCTCMAGLGSCCRHAAALMLKVELWVRFGKTEQACTSGTNQWLLTSRREVKAARLSEICVRRPKWTATGLLQQARRNHGKVNVKEVTDEHIKKLKALAPKAAVLTSLDCSDTDTASESENEDLLEPLAALYDENLRGVSSNELREKSDETFFRLKKTMTQEKCVNLESITKNQAQSQAWQTHRIGRITSTTLHRVCTVRTETAKTHLVKQIMHYDNKDLSGINAIKWGRDNEPTARKSYTKAMKAHHQNFNVALCGLVVHPEHPHLGASPDGVANCSCCGRGTVEIKCPYKYKNGLQGSHEDPDFCLDKSFHLKTNHEYYHQVQLHIFVCVVQYCDFVIWTQRDLLITRVAKDEEMLHTVLPIAEQFFRQSILPELLTRSMDPKQQAPTVCSQCKRPEFGKITTCAKCNRHFHYECAKVKRKAKEWYCDQCKKQKN
ncbi:uncharacterized protein LOC112450070 [Kryptolebias marmoratus]|uniref:uncharacterized protein LOC112450070 n=1 Tax=Kryptolebias marmoratus TaxID=37003 RepID=UPI000D52F3E7|nr:uncharacterized protein LOC112450070 [Kryptolebias marmoratus]